MVGGSRLAVRTTRPCRPRIAAATAIHGPRSLGCGPIARGPVVTLPPEGGAGRAPEQRFVRAAAAPDD